MRGSKRGAKGARGGEGSKRSKREQGEQVVFEINFIVEINITP